MTRAFPTLVGFVAGIANAALVAAGPLLTAQRLEPGAAIPATETPASSGARTEDVPRAGDVRELVGEPGTAVLREPYYGMPPSATQDPAPLPSPPLRRGIAAPGTIDAMVGLVDSDSIDFTVIDLEGYLSRKADLPSTWLLADELAARFRSTGVDSVFLHAWTTAFAPNVIAVHRGATRPREIFLIGGHYDSISHSSAGAPGADDNASGTAAVLECARVLARYRFACTLQFAAWSAEEFGLVGSDAYVDHIRARGDSVLGVINVDMIGYLAPRDRRDLDIISNFWSDWLRDTVMEVAALHVPSLPVVVGHYPGNANSDQASFWSHGFSAISFFEDTDSSSPFIHTGNDVYLTSYNDPTLAWRSTQIAVAVLATLAEPILVPVLVQDFVARTTDEHVELEWVMGAEWREVASVGVERAPYAVGPWTARTRAPLVPEARMRFADPDVPKEPVWYRLAILTHGGLQYAGPLAVEGGGSSGRLALAARDPGPGRPIEIRYVVGRPASELELGVFDVRGRRIRRLEVGPRSAGTTLRYWDRRDDRGTQVTRGVYFVLLDAGAARVTRKLVLVHE